MQRAETGRALNSIRACGPGLEVHGPGRQNPARADFWHETSALLFIYACKFLLYLYFLYMRVNDFIPRRPHNDDDGPLREVYVAIIK